MADLWKGGALKTLNRQRAARYWSKTNPLRNLCGGRLHRWLTLWVLGRGRDSTPWPGWPACRLILAQFVPENCSSPSTDRVTMDTTMWPVRWNAEQLRRWWRGRSYRDTRAPSEIDALRGPAPSGRSSKWRARGANLGAGKMTPTKSLLAKPPPKRSL